MGNRAIIKSKGSNIGIYLHWNGGIHSVSTFLKYCKLRGFRDFDEDGYGMARFCQIVGNFFGGGLSIGILDNVKESDEYAQYLDNGLYIVKGWDIVDHYGPGPYNDAYEEIFLLKCIDKTQPESDRLGDFLDSVEVPVVNIGIHDTVFIPKVSSGGYEKVIIEGFGDKRTVNGCKVFGKPYFKKYDGDRDNINNYILDDTVHAIINNELD